MQADGQDDGQAAKETGKGRVPAVVRAVAVLDLIADMPKSLGVSDIARHLGLPKSSVHGICETLVGLGLLRFGPGGYGPGPRPLSWSAAFLRRSSLVSEFQHLLAHDRRLSDFTVTLSTLDGASVVYLACHNADKPLGFIFHAGMQLPAVYTATGKAMLSALPEAERRARIAGPWHPPFTANSVRGPVEFEQDVQRWRTLGYAVDNGEIREGMVCLGAPILNDRGMPAAGIAVSMTSAEARPEVRETLGAIIVEIARKLSGH
ncbi:IclR family transcriptional regulator [Rhizobiaceae bacterium BDR2-2]|uniref:IclR family transcriptional regulator n=1 Tax=Ectorhizobium quercum TaxID=2965071 RepID=A0AAE3SWY3_9HYPH|nr:IclR family transcriptional regulator [Ectorhizobium quercum]MCX8999905.1 IclR family transcriptional regulator [Ectorhizobium quercum]